MINQLNTLVAERVIKVKRLNKHDKHNMRTNEQ